ncbi:BrnT family toxin [Marinomonas sp. M1K-6]|uniref:BrnT family toxin n=1 Tax=Marinomonas profundi TaxID=2726122 RepID=A0A847R117_9GAMM|nr:BrnT family toxin [Marinomonas profundi]NLQ17292.1 BrnT family toxin [Marinomonas profundi]UDV01821.1 BrnT family toxin [Marinomonas profundi]
MNKFEYDPEKSKSNLEKHGIDFEQAQELWQDSELIEVSVKTTDEPRALVVGKLNKKHWSAIITYRNSNIRIISVRRSRKTEVVLYES